MTKLRESPEAHVIMLIDFDGQFEHRRDEFEQAIPDEFRARVFVVGAKHTPETLKKEMGKSFEDIGLLLAEECNAGTAATWDHEQLKHNCADRQRLVQTVKPFLF